MINGQTLSAIYSTLDRRCQYQNRLRLPLRYSGTTIITTTRAISRRLLLEVVTGLFAFPFFWLLKTGSTSYVWLALVVAFVLSHAAMYGPQGAFLSELFGTRVRYSGASLGTQLASVFAGGLAPLIATALLAKYGIQAVALYVVGMAMVTVVAVLAASETHKHDIETRH